MFAKTDELDLTRSAVIGLTSFLTLIDLFGSQALLPALTKHYGVAPGTMGVAVNASTIGMAVAGIAVAIFGRNIDRKRGIWVSLGLLAIPTTLLATADSVTMFAALRILQGIFMSAAFTLTMAYLAEECTASEATGAMAAYITGNVASNLFGRIMGASFSEYLGLENTFYAFACLNLIGAALVYFCLSQASERRAENGRSPLATITAHLTNPALAAGFAIGFLILFAFVGVFTYVNFVLAEAPFSLTAQQLGFVYLIFVPAMFTTPLAAKLVSSSGLLNGFVMSMSVAMVGLFLLLTSSLWAVLVGLALVAVGTFCAQAMTTGYVGQAADHDRASASGIYLAAYYLGGLVGSIVLGKIFDHLGWAATVFAIGYAILMSCMLAWTMTRQSNGGQT